MSGGEAEADEEAEGDQADAGSERHGARPSGLASDLDGPEAWLGAASGHSARLADGCGPW